MKKCVRIIITTLLGLSLSGTQVFFAAPGQLNPPERRDRLSRTNHARDTKHADGTEYTEDTSLVADRKFTEGAHSITDTELTESADLSDNTELTEDEDLIVDTELTESGELTDHTDLTEETDLIVDTKRVENPEHSPVDIPEDITYISPLDAAHAIAQQVKEAAQRVKEEREKQAQQMAQLKELMDAQQSALDAQASSHSQDAPLLVFPGETIPDEEANSKAETETETESETETEFPEETETEFHPMEMGAALPDTGGRIDLPEETGAEESVAEETETEESATKESPSEQSTSENSETEKSEADKETESPETPPTEESTGEIDDSVMIPRHGTFAIPEIRGLNEARINLYDYRMLRAYPLSRLPKDLHILYRQLKEQTDAYDGTWSVYVQNLNTGQALILNDSSMRSASVMKLFIMETVYEAFDRGDLPRNEDTVYLLRNMIINSSNEASNRLLALLGDGDIAAGIARVNEFIRLRGFTDGTVEFNGFEDPAAAINPDHPNIIMAKDVGLLLSRIYNRAFISRKVCNEIEQMMLDQGTRYKIPRGLPEGVACGNKSGETDTIANDAAVIYGPTTDYILVVLSNDWSSEDTANAQIAEVSKTVYSFFEEQ